MREAGALVEMRVDDGLVDVWAVLQVGPYSRFAWDGDERQFMVDCWGGGIADR